jgi:hypothetical protein
MPLRPPPQLQAPPAHADWLDEYDDPLRAELLRLHRRLL